MTSATGVASAKSADELGTNPDPITDHTRAVIDEAARQAVIDERARVLAEICDFIRNWGGAPPDPHGKRARLAADVRERFGVK